MEFSSDDEDMNTVFSSMGYDMEMKVDGENIVVSTDVSSGGTTVDMEYTFVSNVMYLNAVVSSAAGTQSVKRKAEVTNEQLEEFISQSNTASEITYKDFETFNMVKDGDTYVITCADISTEALAEFKEIMDSQLAGSGAEVTVDNISYVIEIENGKYDKITIACSYTMTVSGQTFTVDMEIEMDYDYDEAVSITAPADASSYTEVDYDDIAG